MDNASELAATKVESWRWVLQDLEEDTRNPRLRGPKAFLRVAKQIAATYRARSFLAGLQHGDLIISTSRDYDEGFADQYVRVGLARGQGLMVTYCDLSSGTDERYHCSESDWQKTLEPLLDRLWHETQGGISISRT